MAQHDNFTADELRQLDRLVDGELSASERQELLASFDAQPERWRRCALAFLEAQSWSEEFSLLGRPAPTPVASALAASPESSSPVLVPSSKMTPWTKLAGLPLAMAATFLLAFGLAWTMRVPSSPPQESAAAPEMGAVLSALASADRSVGRDPGRQSAGQRQDRWGTVTLVMDDGQNGEREVELPVVEEDGNPDAEWLTNDTPVVPPELRQAFERMGHHVDQRRQLVPVQLDDGRQLILPVDDVEFTPVSARSYQ